MKNKTVFVGMSGGVDSSLSATLLKEATPNNFKKLFGRPTPKGFKGYNVVGVFIRTWHPDFLDCNEEEERLDAMRVCAYLDIPFLTFDLEDVYKKEVADYMVSEYKLGRTPNPDVMCNKEVKFGAFLTKALSMGADFIATGHYARLKPASRKLQVRKVRKEKKLYKLDEPYELLTGCDSTKDQSYFLWTLKQKQLNKTLFPIGHLKKTEVRRLAKKFKLPVAEKKDSQGICFLGAVDLKKFLKHYIKEKKGKVVLAPPETGSEKGKEIGFHDGVTFYTLGERHGFTITKKSPSDRPYYVVGKDVKKNILLVSSKKKLIPEGPRIRLLANRSGLGSSASVALQGQIFSLELEKTNWIYKVPKEGKKYTAQIRYHGELLPCQVKVLSKNKAEVVFNKPVLVASGQSCVVFNGTVCLGGGVVV